MSQPNLHLQLCVNDLLHPTEKSESLLEALTATQLEEIEKTLHKIKEKKQSSPQLGKYLSSEIILHRRLISSYYFSFTSSNHTNRQSFCFTSRLGSCCCADRQSFS